MGRTVQEWLRAQGSGLREHSAHLVDAVRALSREPWVVSRAARALSLEPWALSLLYALFEMRMP
ncbi:hypothetical protein TBR22_A43730 [Luteitalea sp. TBR-22]|nr:hypothetical protein TBR22_A43730 [Luteitalea sp. TBR-22]